MARGGARIGAGRPKSRYGVKPAPTVAKVAELLSPVAQAPGGGNDLPMEYMLSVMRDPDADEMRRDRMAIAAAPYLYPKAGETGKKGERQKNAERAGFGKYSPAAPPKLVVNNR